MADLPCSPEEVAAWLLDRLDHGVTPALDFWRVCASQLDRWGNPRSIYVDGVLWRLRHSAIYHLSDKTVCEAMKIVLVQLALREV